MIAVMATAKLATFLQSRRTLARAAARSMAVSQ